MTLGLALVVLAGAGCEKAAQQKTEQPAPMADGAHPGGAPMMGGGMKDAEGPTDGHAVALKAEGLNGAVELSRELAKLTDPELKNAFEMAYRYSFAARIAQRNYAEAVTLANKVIAAQPGFAPAYRVLGYALFNTGQASESLTAYQKSVEIDPNYGEAHYALAFMYAMGDQVAGRTHFQKAMALGITDERDLGHRFYPPTQ